MRNKLQLLGVRRDAFTFATAGGNCRKEYRWDVRKGAVLIHHVHRSRWQLALYEPTQPTANFQSGEDMGGMVCQHLRCSQPSLDLMRQIARKHVLGLVFGWWAGRSIDPYCVMYPQFSQPNDDQARVSVRTNNDSDMRDSNEVTNLPSHLCSSPAQRLSWLCVHVNDMK